jgi:hypothetical protein
MPFSAEKELNKMRNILTKSVVGVAILCLSIAPGEFFLSAVEASSNIMIINETGYDLEEVKYVKEVGETKILVSQIQNLSNGGRHNFFLQEGGVYRVYASFSRGSGKVYAKGNGNDLKDGGQYTLTLKKVVFNEKGTGLNFINRSEFEDIK